MACRVIFSEDKDSVSFCQLTFSLSTHFRVESCSCAFSVNSTCRVLVGGSLSQSAVRMPSIGVIQ